MTDMGKVVWATLAYYSVLDFPMTAGEVGRFLINPQRFTRFRLSSMASQPDEYRLMIEGLLEELKSDGRIEERLGLYFLPGRKHLFQERIERIKIAEEKWKKARRYLFWIQVIPYVEAVLASGSLALGHTTEESDLDVLIITRSGQIWLTRLLVLALFGLMGVRRKKGQAVAPDKICPNHYITDRSLGIPFPSLYNAQTYAHLVPVYVRHKKILEDFWQANTWVGGYLQTWEKLDQYQSREVKFHLCLKTIQTVSEAVFDFLGHTWLEKLARHVQKRRIQTNLPGRITLSDQQLEFHPYSAESKILHKYNQLIATTSWFGDYQEEDSGLS